MHEFGKRDCTRPSQINVANRIAVAGRHRHSLFPKATMNAVLVVVTILAVAAIGGACFFVGRRLGRGLTSSHYGGIGRIREIGELVALRVDCSEVAWAAEPDGVIGRGKSLLAKCDLVIEHRFNLRDMVIRPTVDGVELLVPKATVTINHGDVRVVHMQHGTVLGVPCRRLGVDDINRLLTEARENVNATRQCRDNYLESRAQDSARTLLLSYAAIFAPDEKVRIVFGGSSAATTEPLLAAATSEPPLPGPTDTARRVPTRSLRQGRLSARSMAHRTRLRRASPARSAAPD